MVVKSNLVEADTGTASTTTLAMTAGSEDATLDLTIGSTSGTFASSTPEESAKFTVITNNYSGYTLTISSTDSTDNDKLTNTASGETLNSISTASESGDFNNNEWGYFPSKYNSATNTLYRPAPDPDGSTLDKTETANSEANTYTIGLGAKVDYSKPTGIYTNTYVLSAVGNPADYVINYADNSGDSTVADLPAATEGSTSETSITITEDEPTRNDYTFVGWCSAETEDGGTTCPSSATKYASGATFYIDQTTANTTTLYAVWKKNYEGYLQEFSATTCAAMTTGSTKVLRDNRDNQDYTIAKLADGNCWMDNLNLGDTENYPLVSDLTSANTHLSATVTKETFAGWKVSAGTQSYTTGQYIPVSGTDPISKTLYGTLYNYYATSAGSISGSSNSSDAEYDICPKGWRLPTGGNGGELQTLYNSGYNTIATLRASIANGGAAFALAGLFNKTAAQSKDTNGIWWSSTWNSSTNMYTMNIDLSNIETVYSYNRSDGRSVRCILQSPLEQAGITTMQQMGALAPAEKVAVMADMEDGRSYRLSDSRDTQVYTVAKIDGKIWMTRNLAIGCNGSGNNYGSAVSSKTLTSATSNVSSNYNTPTASLATAANSSATSGFTTAAMNCSATYGAWYNFVAASAGSISGSSNADLQVYDVCPAGWRLFNSIERDGLVSAISSSPNDFRPIPGGDYYNGGISNAGNGYWWTSTSADATSRYSLRYNGSILDRSNDGRYIGSFVRCILKNPLEATDVMQDVTSEMVELAENGDTATYKDSRDSQFYTAVKINDNLWMTRNLAIGCAGTGSTYSASVSSKSLNPATSNTSTTWSTPTALLSAASTSTQTADYSTPRMQCNATYGAWYNYAAASAGTITGASNENEAQYSVCPSGWRLPKYSETSTSTAFQNLFNPVIGGYYRNGALSVTGDAGWWNSTSTNGTARNRLYYENGALQDTTSGSLRYLGFYIRCIKDTRKISDVTYMQDVTASMVKEMNDGDTATLTDNRDSQNYSVAKINGNLWMTRNLAIGCNGSGDNYGSAVSSKSLNITNSNTTSSGWSTPTALLSTAANSNSTSGYTTSAMQCSDAYGAWYNYVSATAGTISGGSNSSNATLDICPAGWRLPTSSEANSIVSRSSEYQLTVGGYYFNGSPNYADSGAYWWTSTDYDSISRYVMQVYQGSLNVIGGNGFNRYLGLYTRCLRSI